MQKIKICFWVFLTAILLLNTVDTHAQVAPKTRILFIFDASGSMTNAMGNTSRFEIARKMLLKMIDSFSNFKDVELALRVYGHQKYVPEQDCEDTKLEVPFMKGNIPVLKKKVQSIQPRGWTPIAQSLLKSAEDFPVERGVRNLIILITDGLEECGGDPCAISKALQEKGIFLQPFIIGVGANENFKFAFNCVGNYYDATTEAQFETVIGVIISQAMNATSCQVNLLDIDGKPLETDVNMSIYDATTGQMLFNYIHTMNGRGVPDTLYLDPMRKYNLVIHTLPILEKKNVQLVLGRHNIIAIDAAQGFIEFKIGGITKYDRLQGLVKIAGNPQTINAQDFNTTKKYLVGAYDLEILTLPRIYMSSVKVTQNYTTTINISPPGKVSIFRNKDVTASIFMLKNNKMEWVCNIEEKNSQVLIMQPGKYFIIGRNKPEVRTIYTFQREFTVTSGSVTDITL